MDPAGRWPVELYRIRAIMSSATAAGDVAVLHECVNILTSWLHKLADWTVKQ
jgi:hypothetical protein